MSLCPPTLTYYARVSRLWTKDIDLTHQGQFLTPDSQIETICSLTRLITKLNLIFLKIFQKGAQFYHNTLKCRLWNSFRSAHRWSEHLRTFSATFVSLWKNWQKCFGYSSDKVKTSRIWLRKSWQVYVTAKQSLISFKLMVCGLVFLTILNFSNLIGCRSGSPDLNVKSYVQYFCFLYHPSST